MVGTPKRPKGRSIQTIVKTDDSIKKELSDLRKELLAQLAAILGEVKAAQILGIPINQQSGETKEDEPVFIPDKITGDMDAEINVQTAESESDVDDAVAALRKIKKKNKEDNSNE